MIILPPASVFFISSIYRHYVYFPNASIPIDTIPTLTLSRTSFSRLTLADFYCTKSPWSGTGIHPSGASVSRDWEIGITVIRDGINQERCIREKDVDTMIKTSQIHLLIVPLHCSTFHSWLVYGCGSSLLDPHT